MPAYEKTFIVVIDETCARFCVRNRSGIVRETLRRIPLAAVPNASAEMRRQARVKFVQSIAAALSDAIDRMQAERLIVIAPERTLALFRKHAPEKIRARLWRECANEGAADSEEDIARLIDPYFRSLG